MERARGASMAGSLMDRPREPRNGQQDRRSLDIPVSSSRTGRRSSTSCVSNGGISPSNYNLGATPAGSEGLRRGSIDRTSSSSLGKGAEHLSRVELMSIKGNVTALHWSISTGWDLLSLVKKDTQAWMSRALKSSLLLRVSLDVIGVSCCLCVHAFTMSALGQTQACIATVKVVDGWYRVPIFVPAGSLKPGGDVEERLKLLVKSLSVISELSENEIASRLDFFVLKQREMRTYNLLFKVYCKLYFCSPHGFLYAPSDFIGMKQRDMRTYDLLYKVYCKVYLARVSEDVDKGLLKEAA
eukprot:gene19112-25716_t